MRRPNDFVIDDGNAHLHMPPPCVDGEQKAKGLVPRDYTQVPVGFYAAVPALDQLTLIPRNEWAERIRKKEADQSCLSHIRRKNGPGGGHIPALDQNGQGFCWSYSAHGCIMLWRAVMGLPYKRLSAHGVACLIKGFKDEGGWAALSADFIAQNGACDVSMWPEKSMSRSNNTADLKQKMLAYKVDGLWRELNASVYDANLTEDQACTLLLSNIPIQGDFNWWSHSVCLMDVTLNVQPTETTRWRQLMTTDFGSLDLNDPKDAAVFADSFGKRGLNSWTDQYGDLGEFVLAGTKARLDGGCAVGVPIAA